MKLRVASAASIVAIVFFFSTANAQERAGQSGSRRGVTVPASQVVNGDYFAFGGTVEIAGTINGDLYASGGQVVIDGTVNGDVLVAGGRVSSIGNRFSGCASRRRPGNDQRQCREKFDCCRRPGGAGPLDCRAWRTRRRGRQCRFVRRR